MQELASVFRAYAELMHSVGHGVDQGAVADFLSEGRDDRSLLRSTIAGSIEEAADEPCPEAVQEMRQLLDGLVEQLSAALDRGDEDQAALPPEELLERIAGSSEEQRRRLADAVASNGHSRFIQPLYSSADQLRSLLLEREEDADEFALVKLVPYLRGRLWERGLDLSSDQIRELLEGEADGERVPTCLCEILRGLNGQFRKGLIPLEELVGDNDPDQWLEQARRKLLFRSHSAMHKAIAEATSLKYDCVHKALSGREKAKRIQAEIKYALDLWLKAAEEGHDIDVNDDYRGIPVEKTCGLLAALEERFDTKEALYRQISQQTGIKAGSVRRYFQRNGQLKYAPLCVYRYAKKLAAGGNGKVQQKQSYLAEDRTRRVAARLSRRARRLLRRWREEDEDPELELEFRETRHELIAAIKERWRTMPAA